MNPHINSIRTNIARFTDLAYQNWMAKDQAYFDESHDLKGKPIKGSLRFRVQARQIFAYAFGANTIYGKERGDLGRLALTRLDFIENFRLKGGGYAYAITQNERGGWNIVDRRANAYEHAFLILALAELYAFTGEEKYFQNANETWSWLTSNLSQDDDAREGFWSTLEDGKLRRDLPREQNPHMHLLESCLQWVERAKNDEIRAIWAFRAETLFSLFERRFVVRQGDDIFLREFFDSNWQSDPEKGTHLEGGHHFEWAWLLHRYEALLGGRSVRELFEGLIKTARAHGMESQESTFGVNGFSVEDDWQDKNMRFWVQTEALKAYLVEYERAPSEAQLSLILKHTEDFFQSYILEDGHWHDSLRAVSREQLSSEVLASSFYHLIVAISEFQRVLGALD